jgi:hypothetical protein
VDMDEALVVAKPGNILLTSDQPGEHGSGHDLQKSTPCDHCCHGSAHYTGLLPTSPITLPSSTCNDQPLSLAMVHSRDKEPPLQPPNI